MFCGLPGLDSVTEDQATKLSGLVRVQFLLPAGLRTLDRQKDVDRVPELVTQETIGNHKWRSGVMKLQNNAKR